VTTTDRIRTFVVEEIGWSGPSETLTDDYPLIANQILDSLGLYTMVTFLESEFGIEVEDEELIASNFGTISAIAAFVASKQVDTV
jgi:acyl carrier protein